MFANVSSHLSDRFCRAAHRRSLRVTAILVLTLGAAAPASAAASATYTVTGFGDPAQTSCVRLVCSSLRGAVWDAERLHPGATISLGAGTYVLGAGVATGYLAIGANLNIVGAGESSTAIKQTGPADTVIAVTSFSAQVNISNLTVTGGRHIGDDAGGDAALPAGSTVGVAGGPATGGIQDNGNLTLSHVAVTGNSATGGHGGSTNSTAKAGPGGNAIGGIEVLGTLTLEHSEVTGNTAVGGNGGTALGAASGGTGGGALGGILSWSSHSGAVKILDSDVSGNTATGGTGGASHSASAQDGVGGGANGGFGGFAPLAPDLISNSMIADNVATGGTGGSGQWGATGGQGGEAAGGGAYETGQELIVSGSTIQGNVLRAGRGGSDLAGPGAGGVSNGAGIAIVGSGGLNLRNSGVVLNSGSGGAAGPALGGVTATAAPGGNGLGGGVFVTGTDSIVNSTITENQAVGSAGSVAHDAIAPGPPGRGLGGGVFMLLPGTLDLASDTLVANSVDATVGTAASGGNLDDNGAAIKIADTILAGGLGSTSTSNCSLFGTIVDNGHNLESDTRSQCKLTQASDLIGVAPQMGSVARFGGAAPSYSLRSGSPARGAGGQCTDPSQAGDPALSTDERGAARHAICDIGAFETQAPTFTTKPSVATSPVVGPLSAGTEMTCSAQATGDGPPAVGFAWLRDGVAIGGAMSSTYTLASQDLGHVLSCSATASNIYGVAITTSRTLSTIR